MNYTDIRNNYRINCILKGLTIQREKQKCMKLINKRKRNDNRIYCPEHVRIQGDEAFKA